MASVSIWFEATRPKTLPAAVAPVLLGSALAFAAGDFDWRAGGICLVFALLVQVGTNFANDYLDGVKGADTAERVGPRRAVASGLIAPARMRWATVGVLALAFCIGLALIPFGGWWLLGVGVASVVCAWCYTGGPLPLAYNGLGDVFVVLFFGFIAVGCTYYVQAGGVTVEVLAVGLACGLLVNNILVVNNYRDREEDVRARKRTLIVLWGRPFGLFLYWMSATIAGLVTVGLVFRGYGLWVLLGLLPVARSYVLARELRVAREPLAFLAALKGAGVVVATYGVLLSLGLWLGA